MSFEALLKEKSFVTQEKLIEIKAGDQVLKFKAHKLRWSDGLNLAMASRGEKDVFAMQIAMSVTDEDGKHMSYDQALQLSDEHFQIFFNAVQEVNKDLNQGEEKN